MAGLVCIARQSGSVEIWSVTVPCAPPIGRLNTAAKLVIPEMVFKVHRGGDLSVITAPTEGKGLGSLDRNVLLPSLLLLM